MGERGLVGGIDYDIEYTTKVSQLMQSSDEYMSILRRSCNDGYCIDYPMYLRSRDIHVDLGEKHDKLERLRGR